MNRALFVGLIACVLAIMGSCAYCQNTSGDKGASGAKPRIVEVKLVITPTYPGKNQSADEWRPIISTLENQQATIAITSEIPAGNGLVSHETSFTVLPTIAADGHITIAGALNWDSNGFVVKCAILSASVKPGEPQKLRTIVVSSEKDKKQIAKLELMLTASIVPDKP